MQTNFAYAMRQYGEMVESPEEWRQNIGEIGM
jgi:hypothetical protein